jgi:NTE family protein
VTEPVRKALVLPGAGARGAYQVGVLKAIAQMLPKRAKNPFAIISGTSAGAINAAVLASRARNFEQAVERMEHVWSNFSSEQVFRTGYGTMLRTSLHWLTTLVTGGRLVRNPDAFFDATPLRNLLERNIDFSRIKSAIDLGYLESLAVTASAYTSARSVTFFQSSRSTQRWSRVRRIGRPEVIGLDHLLASAAVPFLVAPVKIGGEYYGDGAMRHRAPLSSAIRLGADRVLVLGVRDERPDPEPADFEQPDRPSLAHLAGYMLDTLFMDGVYSDIERVTRINTILEHLGVSEIHTKQGLLHTVQTFLVVPDEDIREIAAQYAHEMPRSMRLLLKALGSMNAMGMQLVSYVLFESGFTRELIRMGYRDARLMEEDLRAFMYDEHIGSLDAPVFIKQQMES